MTVFKAESCVIWTVNAEFFFHPLFSLWGYPVGLLELVGSVFGLLGVWLAARSNWLTWPIGLLNVVCFFFLYYRASLYSDMLLQVYYVSVSMYGWIMWRKKGDRQLHHTLYSWRGHLWLAFAVISGTLVFGYMVSQLHLWFPVTFSNPASFAYLDTLVAVTSITATFLQARKKVESWILWVAVDALATWIYWQKDLKLIAIEFFVFTLMAVYGFMHWFQLYKEGK
jgi:nicotinamide mononucleotide transporter